MTLEIKGKDDVKKKKKKRLSKWHRFVTEDDNMLRIQLDTILGMH